MQVTPILVLPVILVAFAISLKLISVGLAVILQLGMTVAWTVNENGLLLF